jgi:hypothetical protein
MLETTRGNKKKGKYDKRKFHIGPLLRTMLQQLCLCFGWSKSKLLKRNKPNEIKKAA